MKKNKGFVLQQRRGEKIKKEEEEESDQQGEQREGEGPPCRRSYSGDPQTHRWIDQSALDKT